MRRDRRWFRSPVATAFAFIAASSSVLWAWRVSLEDMEVSQRAERIRSTRSTIDERIGALSELVLLVGASTSHMPAAFPVLVEAAQANQPPVRAYALMALADVADGFSDDELDTMAKKLVRTTLLNNMHDVDPQVRHAAASALARLGPVPSEALYLLARMAQDQADTEARSIAVERLSQMERRSDEALGFIQAALKDREPEVRASAVLSLSPWISTNSGAARSVLAGLSDPHPYVRTSVQRVMTTNGVVPTAAVTSDLIALLRTSDPKLANTVATLIARMGGSTTRQAAPVLLANIATGLHNGLGLGDVTDQVKLLLKLDPRDPLADDVRQLLTHCLLVLDEPGSRQFAAACLGELGRQAEDCLPALESALFDPDDSVRKVVEKAIESISADIRTEALRAST